MTVRQLRLALFALAPLFLSACVTQPLATDGSATIAADEGLMAVRFISDWKGNDNWAFEPVGFGVRLDGASTNEVLKMRSKDDAQLIALPAGEYTWIQSTIGTNYISFHPSARFTITPGEITYVGDITLQVTSEPFILLVDELSVENNRDETLSRLEGDYGALLNGRGVSEQIAKLLPREL